jgi:UDP-N-acetylmuramate--alanine ligase
VIGPDWSSTIPDDLGRVHFVGIGGSGMSGIAHMMIDAGLRVSGSDRSDSAYLDRLRERGVEVHVGHDAAHLDAAGLGEGDTLVYTSALWPDNPEYLAAKERGLTLLHRSQALHWLSRRHRVVTVAGAHGKTTSTGMLVTALRELGADPGFVNGGVISDLGVSSATGSDELFVLEGDESDRSFLLYDTAIALITNVDADHLDQYGSQAAFEDAFVEFASGARELVVANPDGDDLRRVIELVRDAAADAAPRIITFGESEGVDLRITDIEAGEQVAFRLHWQGAVHEGRIAVPGRHHAVNATGVIAVLLGLGYPIERAVPALLAFGGTKRRFEFKGSAGGVRVYDDYAHNPAEAAAAVAGARTVVGEGRVIAVHQPHLYSRTQMRSAEFAEAYERLADYTVVVAVDGAREDPIPGVTGQLVADAFRDPSRVAYRPEWPDAAAEVARIARPGDIVMTLSCGTVSQLVPQLLDALEAGANTDIAGSR